MRRKRYTLYELLDRGDRRVYVGMTSQRLSDRVHQHRAHPGSEAMRGYLEAGGVLEPRALAAGLTAQQAAALERELIRCSQPPLNSLHLKPPAPPRPPSKPWPPPRPPEF